VTHPFLAKGIVVTDEKGQGFIWISMADIRNFNRAFPIHHYVQRLKDQFDKNRVL